MTQYGYEPLSQTDSGSTLLARVNGVMPALLTNHKGAARPSYVEPGMTWIDDSGGIWLFNLFDGHSDVPIVAVDPAAHVQVAAFVPLTRKLIAGGGIKLNGADEAGLSEDVTITYDGGPLPAGVPTGAVMGFDLDSPPTGWIVGNGAAINRHVYSDLDAIEYCGDALNATAAAWYRCTNTANPNGSRSTTGDYLVTRDLRGLFPRFVDGGRGYDSGRVVGSEQADQNLSHSHGVNDPGHGHGVSDPGHSHSVLRPVYSSSSNAYQGPSPGGGANGNINTGASGTGISISGAATGISIQANGGAEARPKNIALLGCIKY